MQTTSAATAIDLARWEQFFQTTVAQPDVFAHLLTSRVALRRHAMPDGETIEPIWAVEGCYQSAAHIVKAGIAASASAGRAQLTLVHLNPPRSQGDYVIWERICCNDLTRHQFDALLDLLEIDEENLFDFDYVDETDDWEAIPSAPKLSPLWRYHPERLLRHQTYGRAIAKAGSKHHGDPTMELLREIGDIFAIEDRKTLDMRPSRARADTDRNFGRALSHYQETLIGFATYSGHGRQIFDIPQKLTEMFVHSDVDDIQWANVKMPYPCIYLHFGAQPDMDLGFGWQVEGVYICEITVGEQRHVNITVVSAPPTPTDYFAVDTVIPPCYSCAIGPEHMGMPLAEALELRLSEKIAELTHQSEHEPLAEDVRKQAREQGEPPGVKIVSVQRQIAREELALLSGRHDAFKRTLRLVVNALCYLTAYPKDVQTVWPHTTPKHLLRDLERAGNNRNAKRSALNKLADAGFTAVNFCGRALESELSRQDQRTQSDTGDRVIATHWARGHWKRQPHGPQNSLRKLQWRMPVLRRSRHRDEAEGDSPDDALGHIYLAS